MLEQIVVEHDASTGPRLKYFTRPADVGYWTRLWELAPGVSYEREQRGHLPHQLRDTFGRWVKRGARAGVCEHFEEGPASVLAETHRLLQTSGVAVISTPCFNSWRMRRATRVNGVDGPFERSFYQHAFTPEGLARLLTTIGFDVIRVRPYAVLDTFVRSRRCRIPRLLRRPLAYGLDYLPFVRQWGSACLWLARKR